MAKVTIAKNFSPVTIVIESQAELDYVTALLGKGKPSIGNAFGVSDTIELYNELRKLTVNHTVIYGNLSVT